MDSEGDVARPDVMHSYGAALLLSLMHCGLMQQLVAVVLNSGQSIFFFLTRQKPAFVNTKIAKTCIL